MQINLFIPFIYLFIYLKAEKSKTYTLLTGARLTVGVFTVFFQGLLTLQYLSALR